MVGNVEGTVGNFEKTAAFIKATNFLKEEKGVKFVEIGELLGLNKGQMNMLRIRRRHVSKKEIDTLLKAFPDVSHFFERNENEASYENQTLNEPMVTHFYGKKEENPWQELAGVQKKLLEKQEFELAALREKVRQLEVEKKVLTDTIEGILSNNK